MRTQQSRAGSELTQQEKFAVYDTEKEQICDHHDSHHSGAAIADSREAAISKRDFLASWRGWDKERLEIVRVTMTPTGERENCDSAAEPDTVGKTPSGDGEEPEIPTESTANKSDSDSDSDITDQTKGSLTVSRGPHRRETALIEYRQAADGAWAVKTPADEAFWIFLRDGTERDLHQEIRAKWDASYNNSPQPFTSQGSPSQQLIE